ncbi:MAG: hypothetical protein DWQ06_01345 [Calditrichaeota bacterium]|nr:MAG: hypothetical protein DWQ06_01345 [Calditrichota bacterium]
MKKLIVSLTIFSLLFTSCATISNVKPNQNSTKLFSIIEENAKDRQTTVELVNGKFYHTTNLYFKNESLTFVEIDSNKIEKVKLDEIHRIVIEKKDISSWNTFGYWIYSGATLGGVLGFIGVSGENSLVQPSTIFAFTMLAGLTIGATFGLIHVSIQDSNNKIIYNFSH